MFIKKFLRTRTIIALFLIMLLIVAASAYAAANVVPESGAGDGSAAVSGYTVTAVSYSLDGSDPSLISAVSFNITPTSGASPVSEVQVQLVSNGTWFACDESGAPAVTCTITGVTVVSANQFRVVAVQ